MSFAWVNLKHRVSIQRNSPFALCPQPVQFNIDRHDLIDVGIANVSHLLVETVFRGCRQIFDDALRASPKVIWIDATQQLNWSWLPEVEYWRSRGNRPGCRIVPTGRFVWRNVQDPWLRGPRSVCWRHPAPNIRRRDPWWNVNCFKKTKQVRINNFARRWLNVYNLCLADLFVSFFLNLMTNKKHSPRSQIHI